MRVLWFLLLGIVALAWLRSRSGDAGSGRDAPPRPDAGREAASGAPEPMVACAHCGVHLPAAESLAGDGRYYCCEEHRRLGIPPAP